MKYVVSALAETVEIVKRSPVILFLYMGFGLLPFLAGLQFTPPIVDLALAFMSLGWFAARFIYLKRAYQHKPLNLNWHKLLENILRFGLKLLPLVLAAVVVLVVPLLLMGLWYGRWFATAYLNQGLGLTTQQVMQTLVPALFNPVLWQEFFTQNLLTMTFLQAYKLVVLVGLLALKLVMIYVVVEKFNVSQSLSHGFFYLSKHLPLVTSFVLFRILGNTFVQLMTWLIENSLGFVSYVFVIVGTLFFTSMITSLLDLYVFSYYTKADHRNLVAKNVTRWVRSKRNKQVE